MKRVAVGPLAVVVMLSVIAGAIGQTTAAPAPGGGERTAAIATSAYCADAEEQAFLGLINNYRAQNGLVALVLSQTVSAAAEHHSVDMATNNFFDHQSSGGSDFRSGWRITATPRPIRPTGQRISRPATRRRRRRSTSG